MLYVHMFLMHVFLAAQNQNLAADRGGGVKLVFCRGTRTESCKESGSLGEITRI